MDRRALAFVLSLSLAAGGLFGCANLTPAEQRALTGGAAGAAGGALMGAAVGKPATGAAIGGAAGATGGYLYERSKPRDRY
ncbi:MAG: glycine zipper family protein [Pseudomonadota bacterium]